MRGMNFRAGAKLEDAAGIGGDDNAGVRGFRILHFCGEELHGSGCFGDIVNAGRAAALIGELHFDEFDSRDGADKLARRFTDFLAVKQMAGILIGDAEFHFTKRRDEAKLSEKFRGVADAGRKFGGAFGIASVCVRVSRKKMRVFLQS